jgi:hypothetical protein
MSAHENRLPANPLTECAGALQCDGGIYVHCHCAGCGDVIYGEGGGGYDGKGFGGYSDVTECFDCSDLIENKCVRKAGDDKPRCLEHYTAECDRLDSDNLGLRTAANIKEDAGALLRHIRSESRGSRIAEMLSDAEAALNLLNAATYEAHLKLANTYAQPLPGMVAA